MHSEGIFRGQECTISATFKFNCILIHRSRRPTTPPPYKTGYFGKLWTCFNTISLSIFTLICCRGRCLCSVACSSCSSSSRRQFAPFPFYPLSDPPSPRWKASSEVERKRKLRQPREAEEEAEARPRDRRMSTKPRSMNRIRKQACKRRTRISRRATTSECAAFMIYAIFLWYFPNEHFSIELAGSVSFSMMPIIINAIMLALYQFAPIR